MPERSVLALVTLWTSGTELALTRIELCLAEEEAKVKVNLYVSDGLRGERQHGFLATSTPISLLPRDENWRFVRSGDLQEFGLPTMVEEEIRRKGFWARATSKG
jgi:hypothetical protein